MSSISLLLTGAAEGVHISGLSPYELSMGGGPITIKGSGKHIVGLLL